MNLILKRVNRTNIHILTFDKMSSTNVLKISVSYNKTRNRLTGHLQHDEKKTKVLL